MQEHHGWKNATLHAFGVVGLAPDVITQSRTCNVNSWLGAAVPVALCSALRADEALNTCIPNLQ